MKLTQGKDTFYGQTHRQERLHLRHGRKIGCRREETLIVGDRMDTDIIAGIESEIETALVLSGITAREDLSLFPYQPDHVLEKAVAIIGAE